MPYPNRPRPSQLHHHQTHGAEPDAQSARQGLPTPQAKGRRMGRRLPRQPHRSVICSPDCPATWGGAWRGRSGRGGGRHDIRSQVTLCRLPLSRRGHQPRRLAVLPVLPLSLRMVEEMLAARGIVVSHETVRQWARKFGQGFANQIRRRLPRAGDKGHLDEVEVKIAGKKHWLWRAGDQGGTVLDVLVQSPRDKRAAKRLLPKLLKRQGRPPRGVGPGKLAGHSAAKKETLPRRRD